MSMESHFVDALMKTRPNNHPSGQGKGHLSAKGGKGAKGRRMAPAHTKTKMSKMNIGTGKHRQKTGL